MAINRNHVSRYNRTTRAQRERISAMWEQGATYKEISAELSIAHQVIMAHIHREKIVRNDEKIGELPTYFCEEMQFTVKVCPPRHAAPSYSSADSFYYHEIGVVPKKTRP